MEEPQKKKVLILYNKLFHYRTPIFKILADKFDLRVAYSLGKENKENVNFKVEKKSIYKFNRFVIHKDNILKYCNNFDVVIAYGDIAWLKLSGLAFQKERNFKLLFWTIGVSASYNKKFDAVTKWDNFRDFFYKKADGMIFYTDYPIQKYIERGYRREKLFVAPNTVEVANISLNLINKKNSFLFIGTLYYEKGLSSLLENYKAAYLIDKNIFPLIIIGDGKEKQQVIDWIVKNKMEGKIYLKGAIYDEKLISIFFNKAIACLSPNQAGLSVLKSMGYGVPYITMADAITGGERLNITHNINGILYENENDLKEILLDIIKNKQKYYEMGIAAKKYYDSCRTPQDMATGLEMAINSVLNEK